MQMEITPEELAALLKDTQAMPLVVDVREVWEWETAHIEPSLLIPQQQLVERYRELPEDRLLVLLCHHGVRSLHMCLYLRQQGMDRVVSLQGGIDAWSARIDPAVPRY